jgi:ATP-dependent Clp protease ATP-binding subunit ClpA
MTPATRDVVSLCGRDVTRCLGEAQRIAAAHQHEAIGVLHLLHALILQPRGVDVLRDLGVEPEALRDLTTARLGPSHAALGGAVVAPLPIAGDARLVLHAAVARARAAGASEPRFDHLVAAFLAIPTIAATLLGALGLRPRAA